MTDPVHRPDLHRIAASAFREVIDALLPEPPAHPHPSPSRPVAPSADPICRGVPLAGPRLAGTVELRLPAAFVHRAVRALLGLDSAAAVPPALLDDAAGELANMVAGRVAARLAAEGYPCDLGTPSRSPRVEVPGLGTAPAAPAQGRAELVRGEHCLAVEIDCHFASV